MLGDTPTIKTESLLKKAGVLVVPPLKLNNYHLCGGRVKRNPSGIQSEEVGAVPTLRSMSVKGDEMILRTQNNHRLGVYDGKKGGLTTLSYP